MHITCKYYASKCIYYASFILELFIYVINLIILFAAEFKYMCKKSRKCSTVFSTVFTAVTAVLFLENKNFIFLFEIETRQKIF